VELDLSAPSGRLYKNRNPQYGTFVYPELDGPDAATPTVYSIFALNMLSKTSEGALGANLTAWADLLGGRHTILVGTSYDRTDIHSNMGFAGVPVEAICAGYATALKGPFGAGVTAFGARQTTLPNAVSVSGYAMIVAQAAYDIGRFTIQVSAVNLDGRRAYDTYQYLAFPVVMPTQPRSAYVTLKARF